MTYMTPTFLQETLFYLFSAVAVISAFLVVFLNHPVRSALSLVVTFIAMASLWLMARAEFLALVLVLVYVGAVMTLFLFVIMMIDVEIVQGSRRFVRYLPFAVLVCLLLVGLLIDAIEPEHFMNVAGGGAHALPSDLNNTEQLGLVLYTHYAYAFELAAVLLLIAIIAAIVLTHRKPRASKQQVLRDQLQATKESRLHLIKMLPEKEDTP